MVGAERRFQELGSLLVLSDGLGVPAYSQVSDCEVIASCERVWVGGT